MKAQKRVTARRRTHQRRTQKIVRLQAAAGRGKRSLPRVPEWAAYYRPIKKPVTLRLDADVLAWFKRQGRGYQTRINQALRKLMTDEK